MDTEFIDSGHVLLGQVNEVVKILGKIECFVGKNCPPKGIKYLGNANQLPVNTGVVKFS